MVEVHAGASGPSERAMSQTCFCRGRGVRPSTVIRDLPFKNSGGSPMFLDRHIAVGIYQQTLLGP